MKTEELEDGAEWGECEHCGDEGRIFTDNKRCEECAGQFTMCNICKEEQHRESACRHVFQGLYDFEWKGSGSWHDPALKEPFIKLLSLMPEGFARELKKSIRSGKFYTFLSAPLIGAGGHMTLGDLAPHYGDAMVEIGGGPHDEECADGYNWLASLYLRRTIKANRLTVKWIDEFLKNFD